MNPPFALGVDVGGTNIRLAVVDPVGNIGERDTFRAMLSRHDTKDSGAASALVLDTLERAIRPMLDRQAGISGVGIGFPGFFDTQRGLLLSSPNIPELIDFPLQAELAARLGTEVRAGNDAAMAALGETRFGIGHDSASLLHLTLGTGVGGGAVIGGHPYNGDGGMALEVGHLHVAPDDRICGCGATGCLETWASASAVAGRYSEMTGSQTEAREVAGLANRGDATARRVLHEAGEVLGYGIAETVKVMDIRKISISGGLTAAWQHFAPAMQKALNTRLLPPLVGKVTVCRSRLDDDAGILGAAASVFDAI